MNLDLPNSWKTLLSDESDKDYFQKLTDFVNDEYSSHEIFPSRELIFNAFDKCSVEDVKVVILGQDPYHTPGVAHGLCFSVPDGVKIPPSLRNIYKELLTDVDKEIPKTGNLEHWAEQGVLMLNATLTVRSHEAGSHQKKGWETFTDTVIKKISDSKEDVVFILWGAYAQKKGALIDESKHYILKSVHPSPLSA
ncbi:MAG: uracil-DNA glycosylase, partial [Marinifilaceae bacterium]